MQRTRASSEEKKIHLVLSSLRSIKCLNGPAQVPPPLQPKKLPSFNIRFEYKPWNYRRFHATPTSELAEWGVASLIFACCCFRISKVEHCDIHWSPMKFDSEWHANLSPLSAIPCSFYLCLTFGVRGLMRFASFNTSILSLGLCSMTTLCMWKHR